MQTNDKKCQDTNKKNIASVISHDESFGYLDFSLEVFRKYVDLIMFTTADQ